LHRQLEFRPTSAEAVRASAFIDGRTDIWAGSQLPLPFDAAVDLPAATPAPAIFHMSFCGSTLLARLLDAPGKVLALKEPNCLVDLADWKTGGGGVEFEAILRFTLAMLGRSWAESEQILLKPSSWGNNLIDDFPAAMRAVFVTLGRDRFLEAVLRGGTDRVAFAARLAAHLSPFVDGGPERVQAAIDSTPDPIGKAARLALVAHDLELRLFERALGGNRLARAEIVDFSEIEREPFEAATRADQALELGLDSRDIQHNIDRWAGSNAKADAEFSAEQRQSENSAVRVAYGSLMDSSLAWAGQALGPTTLQT
jgi:hypothetical protein